MDSHRRESHGIKPEGNGGLDLRSSHERNPAALFLSDSEDMVIVHLELTKKEAQTLWLLLERMSRRPFGRGFSEYLYDEEDTSDISPTERIYRIKSKLNILTNFD